MTASLNQMKKLDNISSLRVIACFSVFLVHFGQRVTLSGFVRQITDLGQFGVQLFFVLSGYLACLSWFKASGSQAARMPITLEYYEKRAIRLLPLYYFCILYFFITETFLWKSVPSDPFGLYWLRYVFLLNGLIPGDAYFWSNLGITWTIPAFVFFYLIFPALAKYFRSFSKAVLIAGLSILLRIVQLRWFCGFFSALASLPFFMFGVMTYCAIAENKIKDLLCVYLIISLLALTKIISITLVLGVVFSIAIIVTHKLEIQNSFLKKTVQTLDEYSYTIYLVHGIVFCGLLDKIHFGRQITALIAISGTAVITFLVHKYFEVPVQNYLKKKILAV